MRNAKIIVVDDNEAVLRSLRTILSHEFKTIVTVSSPVLLPALLRNGDVDMVLLDINLPEVDGQSVLRELRKTSDIPVIMVTSKNTEMDEVISMSFGADDFIAKPYNPSILLLHIEAVFKRLGKMDADKGLTYKNMTLDTARGVLTVGDNSVELTKNEAGILSYLLKHQNTIVTRDELISYLWDSEAFVDDNTLTVNMNRVRKKLADLGVEDVIRTKRGQGYILA